MVIEKVISELWKQQYLDYKEERERVDGMTEEELVMLCRQDIIELNEKPYCTNMHTLSIMETIGCQHQIKADKIAGCSFCNWDSSRMKEIAHLAKLREKNVKLYADTIKFSFQRIRGENCTATLIEQMSVHDILNEKQYPQEAFHIMFKESGVYRNTPQIGIISARADSVTAEKVKMWRTGLKRSLTIGRGVECGNEFLRNHWLNKKITNENLKNATDIIHKEGGKVCANILLGLPGLSEDIALPLFLDTCQYVLNELQVDYVLISPLINKENTLGCLLNKQVSTISTQLLINAIRGLEKHFLSQLSKITFSPDNLESMKRMKTGKELSELEKMYKSIENMGTVYTTASDFYDPLLEFSYVKKRKMGQAAMLVQQLEEGMDQACKSLGLGDGVRKEFENELCNARLEELRWKHWN